MDEFINIQVIPIPIQDDINNGDDVVDFIIKSLKEKNESLQKNDL
jgi:hypothetical protein